MPATTRRRISDSGEKRIRHAAVHPPRALRRTTRGWGGPGAPSLKTPGHSVAPHEGERPRDSITGGGEPVHPPTQGRVRAGGRGLRPGAVCHRGETAYAIASLWATPAPAGGRRGQGELWAHSRGEDAKGQMQKAETMGKRQATKTRLRLPSP